MFQYFGIFLFKIIEDALATIRLIVVSNGKKILGSILQFAVTIIWIVLTGYVLKDFMKDIFKIISFSLGALFGSYIGSSIEEKIALGTNSFIVNTRNIKILCDSLNGKYNYFVLNDFIILITAPRKEKNRIIKLVKNIDNTALIFSEKIKDFSDL